MNPIINPILKSQNVQKEIFIGKHEAKADF